MTDINDLASAAAGNWLKFDSFAWHDKPDDPEDWAIVYTENRDSTLLYKSNAAAIAVLMKSHLDGDDIQEEHHTHWACGWVDGYAIRVFRDGKITDAFKTWAEIQERLSDYPVLDESDYLTREYEATVENIKDAAGSYDREAWTETWAEDVYGWLSENDSDALENSDDTGGYPNEEELSQALVGLKLV